MDEEKKNILIKTAREYFQSAEDNFEKGRFNSSLILFFKSLIAFVDLFLLNEINETPSSHGRRFFITRKRFPEIYDILDRTFPFYQSSYVQIITKDLVEVIKEDVRFMAEKTKIEL